MKRLLLVLLLLVCVENIAYANSGPLRSEPPPGFNVLPLKSNSVEVLKEDLTFDITANDFPYIANVKARYLLKNGANKSETYSIAFPYVGGNLNNSTEQDKYFNTKVLFGRKKIIPKIKLIPNVLFEPSNGSGGKENNIGELTFEEILSHMKSAIDVEDFDITKYIDQDSFTGELINTHYRTELVVLVLFDITMPAYSTSELEISYNQFGGQDRYKTKDYTYIYNYFLEPAKYWKDFKDLNINIRIPKGYKITQSNLDLYEVKDDEGTYAGHFATLPEKNLEFQVYKSLSAAQKIYEAIDMKLNLRWFIPCMLILGLPVLIIVLIGIFVSKKNAKV